MQHPVRAAAIGLAILIGPHATRSFAAECPTNLATAQRLALVDDKGKKLIIEAADGSYVRRIEDIPPPPQAPTSGSSQSTVDSFEGLFAETITNVRGSAITVIYNKLSSETYASLRNFAPPHVGSELKIDYDTLIITAGSLPQLPTTPARQWHVEWKVVGDGSFAAGACEYPTLRFEITGVNGDASVRSSSTYSYAPDLKTWLKIHTVSKAGDKPEIVIDRSIVAIAIEK